MTLLELFDGNCQEALKYLPLVKSEVIKDQFFLVPWHQYYAQMQVWGENKKQMKQVKKRLNDLKPILKTKNPAFPVYDIIHKQTKDPLL